jgi:hypothetical protein
MNLHFLVLFSLVSYVQLSVHLEISGVFYGKIWEYPAVMGYSGGLFLSSFHLLELFPHVK